MARELRGGADIAYEVHGSGPPVLLIAGTGCDRRWWAMQREALAREHTVVLADMRGAGQSTIYPERTAYTTRLMALDAASLLDRLGLGPAHVMGHSLGSCIAQQLALRHPDRVRSLQLHATWAHADEWLRRGFVGTMEYPTERGDAQMAWRTVGMWIFSPTYLEERSPREVADAVRAAFIENPHLDAGDGLLGHLHADGEHDTRDELAAIDVPTLVTAGELDVCIPPRYGAVVHAGIPGARWHLFRGERSAHAYPLELAAEFNEVTLAFLAECG